MQLLDKILFEVVPPLRSSSAERREKIFNQAKDVLDHLPNISRINVPEVVDENFRGEPYYKHVDVAEFGEEIKKRLGVDVILNKVVVHLRNSEALVEWVKKSHSELNLSAFVWVGGNSSRFSYPGPSVLEVNRMTQSMDGVTFGNILIPTRKHELEKMVEKTRSGCSFFTTQVLFDKNGLCPLLAQYEKACREKGLQPCRIYLSFAPAANSQNLEFLQWLGVQIPEDVLRTLTTGDIGKNSVRLAADVSNEICQELQGTDLTIGLNVEHISQNNFELAVELGRALTKVTA
ncbi:MAG: hypothetical protein ACE5H0_12185 [Bacteroidota bacterium]